MSDIIRKANGGGLQLTKAEEHVCIALNTFNQLRAFKLTPVEVLEWKDSIMMVPGLDLGVLKFVIDQMILGEIPYNKDLGIQNIILSLKRVERTRTGFKILRTVW